jgi:hypothetical protein
VIQERDGERVAVLFIDSEGLSASNVTQAYDAKIFAISALLSSLLVYNTVGNVNQAYLDYIEYAAMGVDGVVFIIICVFLCLFSFSPSLTCRILSRRAQLFSVKVAMKEERRAGDSRQQRQQQQQQDGQSHDPKQIGEPSESVPEAASGTMAFPPLLWVIQDFVMQMEENVTPTEWLHSTLSSMRGVWFVVVVVVVAAAAALFLSSRFLLLFESDC